MAYVNYKPIENLTVVFGIKNLLDKSPPFTNAFQGNFAAGYNALHCGPAVAQLLYQSEDTPSSKFLEGIVDLKPRLVRGFFLGAPGMGRTACA